MSKIPIGELKGGKNLLLKIKIECDCEICEGLEPCWVFEEYEDGGWIMKGVVHQ